MSEIERKEIIVTDNENRKNMNPGEAKKNAPRRRPSAPKAKKNPEAVKAEAKQAAKPAAKKPAAKSARNAAKPNANATAGAVKKAPKAAPAAKKQTAKIAVPKQAGAPKTAAPQAPA